MVPLKRYTASTPSDIEMKDHSLVKAGQMTHDYQATQLSIQLEEDSRLSLTTNGHIDALMLDSLIDRDESITPAILADIVNLQESSPSIQYIAC